MHPVLRALINLSSSKNMAHLDYLLDADLINVLTSVLLDMVLSSSSRASLHVMALQVLGNVCSNRQKISAVAQNARLMTWLIDSLKARHGDSNIQTEVAITLRNMLFHKLEPITRFLFF